MEQVFTGRDEARGRKQDMMDQVFTLRHTTDSFAPRHCSSAYESVGVRPCFLRSGLVHHFLSGSEGHALLREEPRDKHRHVATVLRIGLPMCCEQIPFFELDANQDVARSHQRKHQMPYGHCGRRPEREEPTNIQWMPHEFVWPRGGKLQQRVLFPSHIEVDLP